MPIATPPRTATAAAPTKIYDLADRVDDLYRPCVLGARIIGNQLEIPYPQFDGEDDENADPADAPLPFSAVYPDLIAEIAAILAPGRVTTDGICCEGAEIVRMKPIET